MRTAWFIVIIILLAGWLTAFHFWNVCRNQELTLNLSKSRHELSLDSARQANKLQTAHSDSVIRAERIARHSDSLTEVKRTASFLGQVKGLKSSIAELKSERTQEGTILDPKTLAIESKSDSLILAQEKEIEALRVDKGRIFTSLSNEVTAITQKWESERSESLAKDLVIADNAKEISQLTKLVSRLKTLTWATIGAAVIELLIILL